MSDVLTSVQKTEESLKRLRKDRVTSVLNGINDDDKIRMQLVIDVDTYVEATRIILNDTTPTTFSEPVTQKLKAKVVFQ